jgi:hypothetical protein
MPSKKLPEKIQKKGNDKLAQTKLQLRDFDARAWLKETSIYLVWLLAYTLSIFATRSSVNQYNYVDLFRSTMQAGISDPFIIKDHFWKMIEESAVPMLGPKPTESCGPSCIAGDLDVAACSNQGAYLVTKLSDIFCPPHHAFAPNGVTGSCPNVILNLDQEFCRAGAVPSSCSIEATKLGGTPGLCEDGNYGGLYGFDSYGCPEIPTGLSQNNASISCNTTFAFPSTEGDYGWSYADNAQNGNVTKNVFRSGINGNIIVDGVWIRQLRVKSFNCSDFGRFSDPTLTCFPDWSRWSDVEEKFYSKRSDDTVWADKGPEYVHVTAEESKFPSKNGYHGGGFIFNFDNPSTAAEALQTLKSERWIDLKTRAISTSVCAYNMNNNLFLCCNLIVQIDSLGKHEMNQYYFVVTLNQYDMKKASTLLKLGLQGVVGAIVVYYLIEESREMKHLGIKQYFTGSIWNSIDFMNLILFMVSGYFQYQSVVNNFAMNTDPTIISTARLLATADYTEQSNMVNAVNALLMWMKVFKYLSITKRLLRISTALGRVTGDIAAFLFVLGVVFVGFSVCGYLLFGNDVKDFSTLGETFLKLYRVMLGDWDYSEFAIPAPILGPIYFMLFVLVTSIVLLNFVVGVLGSAYMVTIEEEEAAAEEGTAKLDVLDILLHKGKEHVGMPVDLHALAGLEQRLDDADQDNDGLVDLSELNKLLGGEAEDMFPGKTPLDILKMFDTDGSGNLDKTEIMVRLSCQVDKPAIFVPFFVVFALTSFRQGFKNFLRKLRGELLSAPLTSLDDATDPAANEHFSDNNPTVEEAFTSENGITVHKKGCGGPGSMCCCPCGALKVGPDGESRKKVEKVVCTLL